MNNPNDFSDFLTHSHSDEHPDCDLPLPNELEELEPEPEDGDWEPPLADPDDLPYGWDTEQEEWPDSW